MSPAKQHDLPAIGNRAYWSGPALTVALALVFAALAPLPLAVPAPTLFLLIAVVYAAAIGGWGGGLASALVAVLYLAWLLTDAGRAAQYQPPNRTFLVAGGVALPLGVLAGWLLHRLLQRERATQWEEERARARDVGVAQAMGNRDQQFRTLVEQVRDYAIFMVDAEGYNTTWNEGVRRLLGYEEAEFIGQHGSHIFTPEDLARKEHERELRDAAEKGRASDDRWLVRKDGSRFWATGITTRLDDEHGRLIGYSKVFRDRTAEKQAAEALEASEQRLRVALRAARMGIWRWHLPTSTQRSDGSMARLLGLGDGEVIESYEQFLERVYPDDRDRVDAAFRDAARSGDEMNLEFRVVWPDGTVRWLSDHGQVVRDEAGRPEYLTGAAVDVTERKTAEERLVQAQRMDAVGQLAGGVAHEVNNMMTAVLGFSDIVLRRLDPADPSVADMRQIRRAGSRAAMITGQLLAFSRRQMLRPEVLDLNATVRAMEPILRRSLGEDKLLTLDLAPDLRPVRADPGSMEQVLVNLALNARDAMDTGGTVTIRTRNGVGGEAAGERRATRPPTARYVQLTVSDTGSGMDAATRAKAFEPFFTTKPVGQGTGLGLATVQGIVEQSGGTIRLRSEPREGTTVDVYLPAVDAALPPQPVPADAVEPGGETVLVVEDEELVRSFACRYLGSQGYRCLEAANGREALDLARRHAGEIAVIVTDVVMPEMDGRALAERVVQLRPDLPVLFMSAYSSDEATRRGLIAPGAPYLQKPFPPAALVAAIRDLLDHRPQARGR